MRDFVTLYFIYALIGTDQAQLQVQTTTPSTGLIQIAVNHTTLGCFAYRPMYFSKIFQSDAFQILTPAQYMDPKLKLATTDVCVSKCGQLASYTYAALRAGDNGYCYCFNDIRIMKKADDTACMACITTDNTTRTSVIGCTTLYSFMLVMTTCPQGYYTPPICMDRAKSTCKDGGTRFATVMFNGSCSTCNVAAYELAKYDDIRSSCDVLGATKQYFDFRYSDYSMYNYKTGSVKFLNLDPNNPQMDPFQSTLLKSVGWDISQQTRGVMIAHTQIPTFNVRYNEIAYISQYLFKSRNKGAFYFSLWQKDMNFYKTKKIDESNWDDYMSGEMVLKDFLDPLHEGIQYVNNVYRRLYVQDIMNNYFGFHSVDTQSLGGTGSNQEKYDHSSLVCTPVYSYDQGKERVAAANAYWAIAIFYQSTSYDTIGNKSWAAGTKILGANSNRNWAKTASNYALQNTQGLVGTDYYMHECLMKVMVEVRCPDTCMRQLCNANFQCSAGCVSGYFGAPACNQLCPNGKWGPDCSQTCSFYCSVSLMCDPITGICQGGCSRGRIGSQCDAPCKSGFYGQGCTLQCSANCITPGLCDPYDGACTMGCQIGYKPPLCFDPCPNGQWGSQCVNKCGHCKLKEPCDKITGICRGACDRNYMPDDCQCLAGTWGVNCTQTCGLCKYDKPCNAKNGYCSDSFIPGVTPGPGSDPTEICANNTQPPMCVCPKGTWGDTVNCGKTCGNCLNGFCLSFNGQCLGGCMPGYQGAFCTDPCNTGFWGVNCTQVCGRCSSTTCNSVTGMCDQGCATGWRPPQCKTCADGYWSADCSKVCGKCKNGPCLLDGTCPSPPYVSTSTFVPPMVIATTAINDDNTNCDPGYQPPSCLCKLGFYGEAKCDQACGHCLRGMCRVNGSCVYQCDFGYSGPLCNTPCTATKFGLNCADTCGHCFNGTACSGEVGVCIQGCDPGYMLPNCKCPTGFFGSDCKLVCGKCATGTTCYWKDGICPSGCQAGWVGKYCNCTAGTYGIDCSKRCGNCAVGTCDYTTGNCTNGACKPGFKASLCVDPCDPGTYGPSCLLTCGNCLGCAKCNNIDGSCPTGCEYGYSLPYCTSYCTSGYWGNNCQAKCGYCYNQEPCSAYDGMCERGCVMGYLSPLCTESCPKNSWGFNCMYPCGKCANGTTCNYLDGTCPSGCADKTAIQPYCASLSGVIAGNPTACASGFYIPPACTATCGSCLAGVACDGVTGICMTGCAAGYQPFLCNTACLKGTFGANCLEVCGHCKGGATCRITDGFCTGGCDTGWYGDTCKYTSQQAALAGNTGRLRATTIILVVCLIMIGYL